MLGYETDAENACEHSVCYTLARADQKKEIAVDTSWTRVSYSQFGEDAVLQAYLRNKAYNESGDQLSYTKNGFYVDIGCFHPEWISNSRWLFEQGWRGINVDATPGVKELFDSVRPQDTNLHCAISNRNGYANFYSFGPHSVMNTLGPEDGSAPEGAEIVKVQTMTLETLLDKHMPTGIPIDLLSVDAEGHDMEVLASNNWKKYRPELILVELHGGGIESIISSDIYKFMVSNSYSMYAWTPPTLLFTRVGQ
jgi:FkbM family methyltransferase